MAKENGGNKKEYEKTMELNIPGEHADEKTKAFRAVNDDDVNNDRLDETKEFGVDDEDKQPVEKCEERGSVKDYTALSLTWRVLRPFLIFAVSALLLFLVGNRIYHYIERSYFMPVDKESTVVKDVEIKPGSSLSKIASQLYEEGIIQNKLVFQMYVDVKDMGSSLLAGKYKFSPNMTMDDIIKILGEGDGGRKVVKVTFTEGMTVEDIADTLVSKNIFDKDQKEEFLVLCNDAEAMKEFRFIREISESEEESQRKYLVEGYLFPDTYQFYADEIPANVIDRLLKQFDKVFTLDYEERAEKLGMSIDEVMALASMIEWEGLPKDFKKVSAVFHNRLEDEMKLGSCATLRYVTGVKKLSYTKEEIKTESPFNTYINAGLPIGPVANPGKKAIEAALYPDEEYLEDGYLYFCNVDDQSGDLVFAKTLKQHNKNKAAFNEATGTDTYDTED